MAQTLYRKYRPQTFADVVGQEHVTKTLQNQIKHNSIAHAYLFAGPRGVGKTTTARLLAKAAQAHDKNGEPDETSDIVKSINAGTCLDLVEIDAASNRRIEEVRELREHVKYPPNLAKYKVFIIDEVHMLTPEAFNALLKTLEEPPEFVIFILATTELNKLPDTIISRCQRFDFKLVKPEVLQNRLQHIADLEKIKVSVEVLRSVVKLSGGCVRDAESLFGQILSINKAEITVADVKNVLPIMSGEWIEDLWQSFLAGDLEKSIETIHNLERQGISINNFFIDWLEFLRLVLLWRINPNINIPVYVIAEKYATEVKETVSKFKLLQIQGIIDIFLRYKDYAAKSALSVLALEMAVIAAHELLYGDNNSSPADEGVGESVNKSTEPKPLVTEATTQSAGEFLDWSNIVQQIQQDHPGLGQYLTNAKLFKKGNSLTVTVGHAFHLEVLKKDQSLKILDEFLKSQFGSDNVILVELNESLLAESQGNEPVVDSILETFGGQIIED